MRFHLTYYWLGGVSPKLQGNTAALRLKSLLQRIRKAARMAERKIRKKYNNVVSGPPLRDRILALFEEARSLFSPRQHYIQDYRRLAARLIFKHGHDKAMEVGVGGY